MKRNYIYIYIFVNKQTKKEMKVSKVKQIKKVSALNSKFGFHVNSHVTILMFYWSILSNLIWSTGIIKSDATWQKEPNSCYNQGENWVLIYACMFSVATLVVDYYIVYVLYALLIALSEY